MSEANFQSQDENNPEKQINRSTGEETGLAYGSDVQDFKNDRENLFEQTPADAPDTVAESVSDEMPDAEPALDPGSEPTTVLPPDIPQDTPGTRELKSDWDDVFERVSADAPVVPVEDVPNAMSESGEALAPVDEPATEMIPVISQESFEAPDATETIAWHAVDESPQDDAEETSEFHASRVERVGNRLIDGIRRFPALLVLSIIIAAIAIARIFGVIDGNSFDVWDLLLETFDADPTANVSHLERFLIYLRISCWSAMPFAALGQLVQEHRTPQDKNVPIRQFVYMAAALAFFVGGSYIAAIFNRAEFWNVMCAGLCAGAFGLIAWLLMSEEQEDTFVPQILCGVFFVHLACALLSGGLLIIGLALEMLFDFAPALDELLSLELVIIWIIAYPNLLAAQLPSEGDHYEVPSPYQAIMGYVVFPLYLILLGVLYAYLGLQIHDGTLPIDDVNWFGSFALLVYLVLWLGLRTVEHKAVQLFVRWGWLLVLPVIAGIIWAVGSRIVTFGPTLPRCLLVCWIVVGFVGVVLAALGKQRARPKLLLLVASCVIVFATVTPLNIVDIPNFAQTRILERGISQLDTSSQTNSNSSESSKHDVISAWDYLKYAPVGYYESTYVAELKAKSAGGASFEDLFGFSADGGEDDPYILDGRGSYIPTWWFITYNSDATSLDSSGYSKVYSMDGATYDDQTSLEAKKNYLLKASWEDGTRIELELGGLVNSLIAADPEAYQGTAQKESYDVVVPAATLRVDAGNGRVLALTSATLSVEATNPDKNSLNIEGYLLVP